MSEIFISYAREDLERTRQLAEVLGSLGWNVFIDRRIPAGKRPCSTQGTAGNASGVIAEQDEN